MNKKTKLYLRLNLISLFFVVVSFISVTLAWFVYTGLSTVSTEVNVKAWYIELEKNGEVVSNDIIISLDDIYPGMDPITEEIKIKNLGDSDAQVNYNIISARILDKENDNYVTSDTLTSDEVEDKIAHEYPFHINIDLSKRYVKAQTDETIFKVSISWPLDSGSYELTCGTETNKFKTADECDSYWGTEAYKFKLNEQKKKDTDESYQMLAPIRLDISLRAEQYIETQNPSDMRYRLGNEILYDVSSNTSCTKEGGTCIRTNVIDINNKIDDATVTLLPKIMETYDSVFFDDINTFYIEQTKSWNVTTQILSVSDVLKVVSKDIENSVLVRPDISDLVIGTLNNENRIDSVITKASSQNGYFKFLKKFTYFNFNECYWLNGPNNDGFGFAIAPLDEESLKIYLEKKDSKCKVIPVIVAEKINLKV